MRCYVEGTLQCKRLTKQFEKCHLEPRRLLSGVKQNMRLKHDAGDCAPCRRGCCVRSLSWGTSGLMKVSCCGVTLLLRQGGSVEGGGDAVLGCYISSVFG